MVLHTEKYAEHINIGEREFKMNLKEKIEDLYFDLLSKINDLTNWFRYRTIHKYHIVDTGLEPRYYDVDTRMLHANFALLVDFVEVEKAWMNVLGERLYSEKYSKCNRLIWWITTKFNRFRSPEDGIAYLDWEINECGHENQAKSAKETKELYNWWKIERPNRKDPFDLVGWEEEEKAWDTCPTTGRIILKPLSKKRVAQYKKIAKIEDKYSKEDEQMLIRLIKIRGSLWT